VSVCSCVHICVFVCLHMSTCYVRVFMCVFVHALARECV
jgi:hypothetical protein